MLWLLRCCCLAVLLMVAVRTNTAGGHVEGQCVNRTESTFEAEFKLGRTLSL
jgi:hypothetical protein